MSLTFSTEQQQIRDSVMKLCQRFDDQYWLDRDSDGVFPEDFCQALVDDGWMGIAMPQEYGGSGLGITEAAIMAQAITETGAGNAGFAAIAIGIFGLNPVVVFGTDEQKRRWLPPIIKRQDIACFAVTEPNTGLDTTRLKTRAVDKGDHYLVNGEKIWTSTAQVSNKMLIIARTKDESETKKPIDGLSLFYTDLDRNHVDIRMIDKMGRKCVDSNEMFIDDLRIPKEDLIGEEGKGFRYLLHGLNAERILISASMVGLGRCALRHAANYARERVVFDRPIGMNQGIQHPLAESWAELEAAHLMAFQAAGMYDAGEDCGLQANAGKYLAAEATFKACTNAVMTHGGMGYAKEFHVERYLRECLIHRLAPVSPQLILSFLAEKALNLPKSY
ncbi:MAG: acyl-CoA dehydrogenase family protein [Alphaproteobacteria bacterium]|jgi:acyl-CoA dehydrogenase|nr:acyl-CoA dehydrogenase [Rhodospirillaceae bacterium]MDP6021515.1 acyl-CoA dehydrogenase family protein [Alphaproteobacteria bacterium]MDP7056382.1 acyl-CoA dehydrogenase family protein [Alphaproteobacteria bacterium]MDP7228418.1 acyl-CoA dehydrogenase family protein [Alphaproteobacteria bacterium]MDP7460758.1 acyl-CoA dehydrogenase family protein [Alphaproteobacteria bacterium]|tara:strand:+ start:7715 stop:8881 length:1167 start_codon:yes stop_codon:yes gene_type:complete